MPGGCFANISASPPQAHVCQEAEHAIRGHAAECPSRKDVSRSQEQSCGADLQPRNCKESVSSNATISAKRSRPEGSNNEALQGAKGAKGCKRVQKGAKGCKRVQKGAKGCKKVQKGVQRGAKRCKGVQKAAKGAKGCKGGECYRQLRRLAKHTGRKADGLLPNLRWPFRQSYRSI